MSRILAMIANCGRTSACLLMAQQLFVSMTLCEPSVDVGNLAPELASQAEIAKLAEVMASVGSKMLVGDSGTEQMESSLGPSPKKAEL